MSLRLNDRAAGGAGLVYDQPPARTDVAENVGARWRPHVRFIGPADVAEVVRPDIRGVCFDKLFRFFLGLPRILTTKRNVSSPLLALQSAEGLLHQPQTWLGIGYACVYDVTMQLV